MNSKLYIDDVLIGDILTMDMTADVPKSVSCAIAGYYTPPWPTRHGMSYTMPVDGFVEWRDLQVDISADRVSGASPIAHWLIPLGAGPAFLDPTLQRLHCKDFALLDDIPVLLERRPIFQTLEYFAPAKRKGVS